ncbi:MAG TPA: DUF1552 domain-containing protein [Polyangiaceae bacterium]|nr:DUF1552 domain-containing protein [Polyangiaceae bacterium]
MSHISRRALLSTFAGIATAGYFQGLLREAFAQEATAPRLIVLSNPHGCAADLWRPRAVGGGVAAETGWVLDYDPDASLGPLEPHKDSLVIIEGLDLTCNYTEVDPILTGHNGGNVAPLTGRHSRGENDSMRTDGPSIDHVVAKQLATKPFYFKPLGYAGGATAISYDDAGEQIPYEYDLRDSYKSWFGSFTPPSDDPTAKARSAADLAVVSNLKDDANRLRLRLAGPERAKVEQHLDALNLLEKRLQRPTSVTCQKPAGAPSGGIGDETYLRTCMDFGLQLLACGLTQTMTLILDLGQTMPWVGLGDLKMHDDVAHGYRSEDPATVRQLAKLQRWYAAQVAYMIEGLKAIREGDKTAYDNSIILWTNELGDPARHMNNNVPYVVAGGGGTYKKGRFLQLGYAAEYRDPQNPHNGLLASIANQFGMDMPCFGDARFPGELTGFLG